MSYLSYFTQKQLQSTYSKHNLLLDLSEAFPIVKSSCLLTKEKVEQMIKEAGYCPLVSELEANKHFSISVTPYAPPLCLTLPSIFPQNHGYYSSEELSALFEPSIIHTQPSTNQTPVWESLNYVREPVSSSLSLGLTEMIARYARQNLPIIEIGSGIGYSLLENSLPKIFKFQPNGAEYAALQQSSLEPVYPLNIYELCQYLLRQGKKIPLFFALNVFDTLSSEEQISNLSYLHEVQNSGDHLLILSDTNPLLEGILNAIKEAFPETTPIPFFEDDEHTAHISFILVPKKLNFPELSAAATNELIIDTIQSMVEKGITPDTQIKLRELQKTLNLKVINAEEFYIEQMQTALKKVGYEADVYRHVAFALHKTTEPTSYEVIYRAVTDPMTKHYWTLHDPQFIRHLKDKKIPIPPCVNSTFAEQIKQQGKVVLASELLVIAAKKI